MIITYAVVLAVILVYCAVVMWGDSDKGQTKHYVPVFGLAFLLMIIQHLYSNGNLQN